MCGIAGYLSSTPGDAGAAAAILQRMCSAIQHRGPDHSAGWINQEAGIHLGHCRLAVIDLSPAGNQPMHSSSGRYVVVYNGEIYNHQELRTVLGPEVAWRGHSDTEVLLAGFERWGVEATLQRAVGMFALALWDSQARELILACDRFGEKPLYWGWQGNTFLFGSELRALRAHPAFSASVSRDAVAELVADSAIAAPASIFEGIQKLTPATLLRVRSDRRQDMSEYWSAKLWAGNQTPLDLGTNEAIDELDRRLREAVRLQMVADVPVGAFLSGGIDSSLVTALMCSVASGPVNTFTIGFESPRFNEAPFAREVARELGTSHLEHIVTAREAMDVVPELPKIYDEPFADSSQIPTLLVCRLARQSVTVALSGDGGDELFGGYMRYRRAQCLLGRGWPYRHPLALAASGSARLLGIVPGARVGIDRLTKLSGVWSAGTQFEAYRRLLSAFGSGYQVVSGGSAAAGWADLWQSIPTANLESRMMFADVLRYLPADILPKVDRAAMSVSLETRVPLLDHRVAEFAFRLPLDLKIRNGTGKWILKEVLARYVRRELIDRPKAGFAVPLADWLRGPLRKWAADLLAPAELNSTGILDEQAVLRLWQQHQSGTRNWSQPLWAILMFQSWLRESFR